MKKIFSYLIMFVFVISCLCACNLKMHEHSYDNWHDQIDSTCQSQGTLGYYECECGKKFDKDYKELLELSIPVLEHEYDVSIVESTCTKQGYTLYECKNCEHSLSIL